VTRPPSAAHPTAVALLLAGVILLAPGRAAAAPLALPTTGPAATSTVPPSGAGPGPWPSVSPGGAPTTSLSPGSGSPGIFDLGGRVRQAVNDWFRDLVASALTPTLRLLGHSVLATPDVAAQARVRALWAVSANLANTGFVLLVLAGGIIVMAHETVQTRTTAKDVAPRLVVGFVAANTSLALAQTGIGLANALSGAFLGQGADPARASQTIQRLALAPLDAGASFLVLLGLVVAVLAVGLVGAYVVRVCLVVVLVVGAPLALACHALPQTEGLALLWWRAFTACLAVQAGQSLVLVVAVRVFFDSDGRQRLGLAPGGGDLVNVLLVGCLLWILLRIPVWAGRWVFGGRRAGMVVRATQAYVVTRLVRRALAGGGGAR
jgi:hypothetical protein